MIAVAVAPYLGISHGILDTSSRVSREFKPRFRASTFWSCTQTLIDTPKPLACRQSELALRLFDE